MSHKLAMQIATMVAALCFSLGASGETSSNLGFEAFQSLPREYVIPIPIPNYNAGKSVSLKKIVQTVRLDQTAGRVGFGYRCSKPQTVPLEAFRQWYREDLYRDIFKSEFQKQGYRLIDSENNLFKDEVPTADLQIGGKIVKIFVDACIGYFALPREHETSPWVYQEVVTSIHASATTQWQIYDPVEQKVIKVLNIDGEFFYNQPTLPSIELSQQSIQLAFRDTVSTLMADREFYRLVFGDELAKLEERLKPAGISGVQFDYTGKFRAKITRKSITVVTAGADAGEGIILSKEGYILTSLHPTLGEGELTVILHNGKKFKAHMVQFDPLSDLALIRISPGETELIPMPLRKAPTLEGEKVIVIGDGTRDRKTGFPKLRRVKKGIVKAITLSDVGHRILVADVPLKQHSYGKPLLDKHGNLMGMAIRDYAREISRPKTIRFVSIDSALDALLIFAMREEGSEQQPAVAGPPLTQSHIPHLP